MDRANDDRPRYSLRQLFIAVTAIALLLAVGVSIYRWRSSLKSFEEMNQVVTGMSKEEVVAILGEPHDKDSESEWFYNADHWRSDGPYFVEFDENGRLVDWY